MLILFGLSLLLIVMQIDSIYLKPVLQILKEANTVIHNPTNIIDAYGSIQENFGTIKQSSVYNAHGIVTPQNPNSLIAKV
jgi:hypothetical protein